jgi:UrcA family protein
MNFMVMTEAGDGPPHPTSDLSDKEKTMNHHNSISAAGWACAAILAGALSTGACAAPESSTDQRPHMKVKYGDLNLNTRGGIDTLYRRIKGAARAVCDQAIPVSEPLQYRLWSSCFDTAVADAVSKVNNAQLTLRHAEATNRRVG